LWETLSCEFRGLNSVPASFGTPDDHEKFSPGFATKLTEEVTSTDAIESQKDISSKVTVLTQLKNEIKNTFDELELVKSKIKELYVI